MEDGHDDDGTLSPEDLRRLGLAGQGRTRFLDGLPRRIREDLTAFRRKLRPSWRGLAGTVTACAVFSFLGTYLPWSLHDWEALLPFTEMPEPAPLLEGLLGILKDRAQRPWEHLARESLSPWQIHGPGLGPILAILAGVLLLRSAAGSPHRVWIGAATIAAGATGLAWALSRPSDAHNQATFVALLVPGAVVTLSAVSTSLWLALRATRLAERPAGLGESLVSLFLVALIALNLAITIRPEIQGFAYVWQLNSGPDVGAGPPAHISNTVQRLAGLSAAILCALLVFVPAWVVLRGQTFRAAATTMRRLLVWRKSSLLASWLGLAVVAMLPIRAFPYQALKSLEWVRQFGLDFFPDSPALSFIAGLETGIFVYVAALFATALHDSLPTDADVTPPDTD